MAESLNINIKLNLIGTQRVVAGHPWVRLKDLNHFRPLPAPGETVRLQDAAGNFLAHAFSEGATGDLAFRVLSRERHPVFDAAWWEEKVERALGLRRRRLQSEPDGMLRLINGEADGLPGLFCDKFGPYAVLDVLSPGALPYAYYVEGALQRLAKLKGLVRKVRFRGPLRDGGSAGEAPRTARATRTSDKAEVLPEPVFGEVPRERFLASEWPLKLWVDLWQGAHEGVFLDQRENRGLLATVTPGLEMLNGFCYTGAFSAACLKAGAAKTVNVDISRKALDWARDNLSANGLDPAAQEWHAAEVFEILGAWAKKGRSFGLVLMDPPPYSRAKHGVFKASRDYAKLAERSLKVVAEGGYAAFSCGAQDYGRASFMKHLAEGAAAAGARSSLVALGRRGEDFPLLKGFPEGDHQKFALLKVEAKGPAGSGTLTGV
jgi:23S rRNA (cytosine1962-C5)-methyltransferase